MMDSFEPKIVDVDLPWCPIYVADFLADYKVQEMSGDDQGAYLVLLLRSWEMRGRGFEGTPHRMTRWGFGRRRARTLIRTLVCAFFVEVDGRWYSPRLERIRQEQLEAYEARARGGRAAARARIANAERDAERDAEHIASQNSELREKRRDDDDARDGPSGSARRQDSEVIAADLLMQPPFNFGHAKAWDVVSRLGTTPEDVGAWREYEQTQGTRLASLNLQRYRNPDATPPPNAGKTAAQVRREESDRETDALCAFLFRGDPSGTDAAASPAARVAITGDPS